MRLRACVHLCMTGGDAMSSVTHTVGNDGGVRISTPLTRPSRASLASPSLTTTSAAHLTPGREHTQHDGEPRVERSCCVTTYNIPSSRIYVYSRIVFCWLALVKDVNYSKITITNTEPQNMAAESELELSFNTVQTKTIIIGLLYT